MAVFYEGALAHGRFPQERPEVRPLLKPFRNSGRPYTLAPCATGRAREREHAVRPEPGRARLLRPPLLRGGHHVRERDD